MIPEEYKKARTCLDEGKSSQACKDIAKQGGRDALVAAGLSKDTADDIVACASSGDGDSCAKAAAKVAAVYGCTSATGGAGAPLCSELAPVVVDKIWPVVGPPLAGTWDIAKGLLGGVTNILKGIADAFAGIFGFGGDDGPSWTDLTNALLWKGYDITREALDQSVHAVLLADSESKLDLGLGRQLPIGVVGWDPTDFSKASKPQFMERERQTELEAAQQLLTDNLRRHPGFGAFAVRARSRGTNDYAPIEYEFVPPATVRKNGEVILRAPAMPDGWSVSDQEGWLPNGYELDDAWNSRWNFQDLQNAYGLILAERTKAIREAAAESVGQTIAHNVVLAQGGRVEEPSESSPWPWLLVAAGAVAAYVYRDRLAKLVK